MCPGAVGLKVVCMYQERLVDALVVMDSRQDTPAENVVNASNSEVVEVGLNDAVI